LKKFSIRGVGLLSFIILTGDLWEVLSGSSISCASLSIPTRYLLCSIRDITDLGITCLKLLNHGITIDYAYAFQSKLLSWVVVISGGSFLGLAGTRIEDPMIKCRNPYLYVPVGLTNKGSIRDLISKVSSVVSRSLPLGEGSTSSATVRRATNHLVVKVVAKTQISVRTLREIQEKLVRQGIYSIIKCASRLHKQEVYQGLVPLINALAKYV